MYSTVVRCLYQKCKCKTVWAYLQNFVMSPCMEYFQCKVARYLHDLESYGVMHLSQDESSYIDIVLGWHCNERYRIDVTMRNNYASSVSQNLRNSVKSVLSLCNIFHAYCFINIQNDCSEQFQYFNNNIIIIE